MKNLVIFLFLFSGLATWAAKPVPSDPKATPEAVKLYQKMLKLEPKGMMFGHQDAFAYGTNWYAQEGRSDVKDVCGDHPAIIGWELGHLELGGPYSLDSVYFDNIRKGVNYANKIGAINTISWHFRNLLTGGTAWDVSSKKTVASILPGSAIPRQTGHFYAQPENRSGEKHSNFIQAISRTYRKLVLVG